MIEPATGRGGGWVIAQFGVMAVIVVAAFLPPHWPTDVRTMLVVAGVVLFIVGIAFAVAAARAMGSSLTPFPSPRALLACVWVGKLRMEETQLRATYAGYDAYAQILKFRLVPGLF